MPFTRKSLVVMALCAGVGCGVFPEEPSGGAESPDAAPRADAGRLDAARSDASPLTTTGVTCPSGTLADGGSCQACNRMRCASPTCDDGTQLAASLRQASLDCQLLPVNNDRGPAWESALNACAELGPAWHLVSKGEALRISTDRHVCRTPLPTPWRAWTSTCAGAGLVWHVGNLGDTPQSGIWYDGFGLALCVR